MSHVTNHRAFYPPPRHRRTPFWYSVAAAALVGLAWFAWLVWMLYELGAGGSHG